MSKEIKQILIGFITAMIISGSTFFLVAFKDNAVHENKQDDKIKTNETRIKKNTYFDKERNKAINLRITKTDDKNISQHNKVLNEVDSNSKNIDKIIRMQYSMNAKIDIMLRSLGLADNEH